jgi:hypothetical protein
VAIAFSTASALFLAYLVRTLIGDPQSVLSSEFLEHVIRIANAAGMVGVPIWYVFRSKDPSRQASGRS